MDSNKILPAGDVALMFPQTLSADQVRRIEEAAAAAFPDRRFIVLWGGATVASISPEQLDRIEAKLDALIQALAEEGEIPPMAFDFDGDDVGGERDKRQEL